MLSSTLDASERLLPATASLGAVSRSLSPWKSSEVCPDHGQELTLGHPGGIGADFVWRIITGLCPWFVTTRGKPSALLHMVSVESYKSTISQKKPSQYLLSVHKRRHKNINYRRRSRGSD